MQISKSMELRKAIDRSLVICDALESIGKKDASTELRALINAAIEEKFVVGVIGSAKRGKSTLINGLLGQKDDTFAPIGKFPMTNVMTVFTKSNKKEIKVEYESGEEAEIDEAEIKQYSCEEHNPNNSKRVKTITVAMPFPQLEHGVCIVDTPGANNALDAQHGEILFKFLPQANALIFLLSADKPIAESEQNILQAIRGNDVKKIFFALNKVDKIDSGDISNDALTECLDHNEKVLNSTSFTNPNFYRISAKKYFETGEDSGVESLITDIKNLFDSDKGQILTEQLIERSSRLLLSAKEEVNGDLARLKWSDSDIKKAQVEQQKVIKDLQENKTEREDAFYASWSEAFEECEKSIPEIKNLLKEKYLTRVRDANSLELTQLGATIHSEIQSEFCLTLQPLLEKCDARVKVAQSNLIGSVQKSLGQIALYEAGENEDGLLNPLKNVSSAVPSLMASAFAYVAPAVVPSVIGLVPVIGTTSIGWAVGGLLSVVALPVSVAALGFAGYRAYNQWKNASVKQKTELIRSVQNMIEDACQKTSEQVKHLRSTDKRILEEFNLALKKGIQEAEEKISNLAENKPSPEEVSRLEKCKSILDKIDGEGQIFPKKSDANLDF